MPSMVPRSRLIEAREEIERLATKLGEERAKHDQTIRNAEGIMDERDEALRRLSSCQCGAAEK